MESDPPVSTNIVNLLRLIVFNLTNVYIRNEIGKLTLERLFFTFYGIAFKAKNEGKFLKQTEK